MRALTVPIHTNGPYAGTLTVAFSQSDVIRSTRTLLRDVAIASCIGLGFAGLLGLVAMRRSSRLAWAGA